MHLRLVAPIFGFLLSVLGMFYFLSVALAAGADYMNERDFDAARTCNLEVLEVERLSRTGDPLAVSVDGSQCGLPAIAVFEYVGVPMPERKTEGLVTVQVSDEGRVRHTSAIRDEAAASSAFRTSSFGVAACAVTALAAVGFFNLVRRRRS